MDSRFAFRRCVLPHLVRVVAREQKNVARSGFGLGRTVREKQDELDALQSSRFAIDFRVPDSVIDHSQPRMTDDNGDDESGDFDAQFDDWKRRQHLFSNIIEVECVASDVTTKLRSSDSMPDQRQQRPSDIVRLTNIKMEALATDPSPLYTAVGLERPLPQQRNSKSRSSSKRNNDTQKQLTMEQLMQLGSGGSGGGGALATTAADPEALALAHDSDAQELTPWQLRGLSLAEYRRSFYRIGTDSIFTLGKAERPVRFVAANFVPRQFFVPSSSSMSHLISSDFSADQERAWMSAMDCSKRALEACSTLLHEKAVVAMTLLRRSGARQFRSMSAFDDSQHSRQDGLGVDRGTGDDELERFLRNLRSGFGSADVIPLKMHQQSCDASSSSSSSAAAAAAAAASSGDLSRFEPVLVVCSSVSSSVGAKRTHAMGVLPNQRRQQSGDLLVGGGNEVRLRDYSESKRRALRRDGNAASRGKYVAWRPKRHHLSTKDQSVGRNFARALVPGAAKDSQAAAAAKRSFQRKRDDENRKIAEQVSEFELGEAGASLRNN